MNGIIILFERQVISILSTALFAVIFMQVYAAPARAANNYSAEEKIYLKNVTPILYEYSQVASQVSANVLPLQSAPPEECSSEFSNYHSIMSSLGKQLGTITPPARFEPVQADSASAISDYERALNLYGAACTQEDFGTKEELVSRASAGVNRSVAGINKVYKNIENLGAVAAAPPAVGSTAAENLSETAIETAPSEEGIEEEGIEIEEQYVEEEAPAAPVATPAPKTREEILEELSGTADTGAAAEAVQAEKAAPVAPAVEAPKTTAPPAVKAPEPTRPATQAPVAPPPAETAKIETPAATAPPAPVVEPEPVATKTPPAPEKPEAAKTEPVPSPEAAAPAATEEASPPAGAVSPEEQAAVQEALQAAEEVGPPPPGPEDVTEKSKETAALAPEELKEEALPEDEIDSWCNSRYQIDFERAECVKKRTEARDKAEALVSSFEDGTPEREIVEKCRSDWKEGVTYNYEMVVSCTQFFCNQKGLEACTKLSK